MNRSTVLSILFSLFVTMGIAQPANDNCQFAQAIIIPPAGNLCFNGTNLNATPDGIFNTCNAPGGGNEVWYTFVAPGNNTTITVTPIGAVPAQTIVVSVPAGNCTNTTNLVCQTAAAPNAAVTINPLSLAGQQIWFEVSSLTADGEFEVCITSSTPPAGTPGDSCSQAISICSKGSFTYMGPTLNSSGLIPSCWPVAPPPAGNVNHDMWFKFTVGKTGALVWRVTPLAPVEYDWALYDITGGCPGVELACNYAFGPGLPFGMDSSSIGCAFTQYCPPIIVTAGSTYAIMIDDFSGLGSPLGMDFEWGGTFEFLPHAIFTIDNPVGCGALSTTFTDSSGVSPLAVYSWDFGNGNTSNMKNPGMQSFSTPGNYIVTLSISDTTGCTSTYSQTVIVSDYVPGILTIDTLICSGSNDTVSYAVSVNDSLSWNFGNAIVLSGTGAGPYIIQWPSAGSQVITLNIVDTAANCFATITKNITVISGVSAALTMVSSACVGDQIQVAYTGQIADTLYWNFGNSIPVAGSGTGPYTITWNASGNDTIRVTASVGGCTSSIAVAPINIIPIPTSSFNLPATACTGDNVLLNFTGSAPASATYLWTLGGATVNSGSAQGPYSLTWNTQGVKNITLSVNDNGCISGISSDSILVSETPTSAFVTDTALLCGSQLATFTYIGSSSPSAVFTWNFSGGNIVSGSGQGPYQINWVTPGIKSVTVFVLQDGCYSDTTEIIINVGSQPIAIGGPDQSVCTGDTILLGAPAVPLHLYSWTPPAGLLNSNFANPLLTFAVIPVNPFSQQYIITVQSGSCTDKDTVNIIIYETPSADFAADDMLLCDQETVNITYNGNATVSAVYHWNFNGGTVLSGSGQGPYQLSWNSPGIKTVSLWVDENGCVSDTNTITIDVAITPVANAGSDQTFCSGDTIILGAPAVGSSTYSWLPITGIVNDTVADPELSLQNSGANNQVYSYTITVSNRHCSDTDAAVVTVKPVQQAQILGPAGQCIDGNSFAFLSGGVQVTGSGFNWNFGPDAVPASSVLATPPAVTFNTVGPQLVTLTTSTPGCKSNMDTLTVFIYPMPSPGFVTNKDVGCPPMQIQFTDTSVTSSNSTYLWNFGQAGSSTLMNPKITFNESGFYDVTLTVTTDKNCSMSITLVDRIEVLPKPSGTLYADPRNPLIIDPVVNFTYSTSEPVQCFYQFGDGSSSAACDPDHKYNDIGTYLVQLVVTNTLGCADTLYEIITVSAFYSLYVPSAFTPNNDNRNDIFLPFGYGITEYTVLIYDRWGELVFESDNINNGWNGKYNNSTTPAAAGVYVYKIFARDDQGKKHNKTGTVTLIR